MEEDKTDWTTAAIVTVIVLLSVGFIALRVYVGVHFLRKYW